MTSLISFIIAAGYLGVFGAVFAETGLLVGLFLPGDSLLFTAGFLASQNIFRIELLCVLTMVGAMLGDNTGYWLGRKFGPSIFSRERSRFFKPSYIERTQSFFTQYGSATLILARFIPIVRTITPTMAGVGRMRYAKFFTLSVIAGALWGIGLPLAGYWLGRSIPGIDRYLVPIILGIILLSVSPGLWHILRNAYHRRRQTR